MDRIVLLLLLLGVCMVNGHSWMQCADYTEENGRFWDASLCRAWPRNYDQKFQFNGAFGGDVGMDFRPTENNACQAPFGTAYTAKYPSGSYAPGQRVCMAWPPKNHVAANCDNPNIPDFGTQIKRSGVNPTSDPKRSDFLLMADLGINSGSGKGDAFQNCPDFCANKDKALCTGCFDIPDNLAEGKYVFMWEWAFNGPNDLYSTCFDVSISKSVKNTEPVVYTKIGPDAFVTADKTTTAVSSGAINNNNNKGSNNKKEKTTFSAGSVAAGVIITFIGVTAIFVGLIFTARAYPHSKVGGFVHGLMNKQ